MSTSNSATNKKNAFNLGVLLGKKNEEVEGEGLFPQPTGFLPALPGLSLA